MLVASKPRKRKTTLTKLARDVRELKKDTKDIRHNFTEIPYSASGNISYGTGALIHDCTANMVVGDNANGEFEGATIRMHRLKARFCVQAPGAAATEELSRVRIMVFVMRQPQSTILTSLGKILVDYNSVRAVDSMWATEFKGYFKVLYDKTVILGNESQDPANIPSGYPHYRQFKISVKIPPKWSVASWNPTTGSFDVNRVFLALTSDSSAIPHPGIYASGTSHVGLYYSA